VFYSRLILNIFLNIKNIKNLEKILNILNVT
jgi:hypothetical protein